MNFPLKALSYILLLSYSLNSHHHPSSNSRSLLASLHLCPKSFILPATLMAYEHFFQVIFHKQNILGSLFSIVPSPIHFIVPHVPYFTLFFTTELSLMSHEQSTSRIFLLAPLPFPSPRMLFLRPIQILPTLEA